MEQEYDYFHDSNTRKQQHELHFSTNASTYWENDAQHMAYDGFVTFVINQRTNRHIHMCMHVHRGVTKQPVIWRLRLWKT